MKPRPTPTRFRAGFIELHEAQSEIVSLQEELQRAGRDGPVDSRAASDIIGVAELDEPVRCALRNGSILLLRCDWLLSPESDSALRLEQDGALQMRRRQDLPADAFFSPEAGERIFSRGDRSVLVLSYGWWTTTIADPDGCTLAEVRRYLRSEPTTAGCGLFWDVACRPQGDCTDDEKRQGQEALEVMSCLYASVVGTTVLQQKDIPPRPARFDGMVRLFSLPPHLRSEAELRAHLCDFGIVTSCELETYSRSSEPETHATVRFANHAEAQSAVFALKYEREIGAALI